MKALTGSCSKAIVESSWERRVGSVSVSDHQRHEFCLRPLLRNDKAFNSRLLQLGSVKRGFQPLHAIESKIQDLETVDPEAQDQQITRVGNSQYVRNNKERRIAKKRKEGTISMARGNKFNPISAMVMLLICFVIRMH